MKPHWHADESLLKWQSPGAKRWESNLPTQKWWWLQWASPEAWARVLSALSTAAVQDQCLLQGRVDCPWFLKTFFLEHRETCNPSTSGKEILVWALGKGNVPFSEVGKWMWRKEVQTQTSTWVGQAMQWNQLETLNSKLREGTGSGRVSLLPNYIPASQPLPGARSVSDICIEWVNKCHQQAAGWLKAFGQPSCPQFYNGVGRSHQWFSHWLTLTCPSFESPVLSLL